MPKAKGSKNKAETKDGKGLQNLDEGIEHNANKVSLGPNTKR